MKSHKFMMLQLAACLCCALASGCGPDCQSTCNKLYAPAQCGIERPGQSKNEQIDRCMNECESALKMPGEVEDYDPNLKRPPSETPELNNDKQAALWMECIQETACENLEKNYCAPVW